MKEEKVLVEIEVKKDRKEAAERMKAYAERLSKLKQKLFVKWTQFNFRVLKPDGKSKNQATWQVVFKKLCPNCF